MQKTARRLVLTSPALLLSLAGGPGPAQEQAPAPLAADRLAALDRISADSLKGHLSFLASDLLEGRDTPSRGLDLAAEYIAAQFRRAGLEPVGDDGYFQTARWEAVEPDSAGFRFEFAVDGKATPVDRADVFFNRAEALEVPPSGVFKVDVKAAADLDPDRVAGKVVLVEPTRGPQEARGVVAKLVASKAALIVFVLRKGQPQGPAGSPPWGTVGRARLVDPEAPGPAEGERPGVPIITVGDPKVVATFDAMPDGEGPATAALHLGPPARRPVVLRNVVGLLRGSDPELKDTCAMVTAHYDHVGVRGAEGTDRIFNGANDDGSGTVSVIELASALATLKERPRRSLLFAAFFGEEKGLLGSRYYGRHPIIPVEKTVADLNLEQVGRTDSSEGPQVNRAGLTGFGYSGVSTALVDAGKLEGVEVYGHPRNSDAYFGRSDNQALADLGVPAHTLCVAFQYPDYHGAADHWEKVDYANMARVDRAVARALLGIADDPAEPRWDESNPKAAKYLKAWKDRRGR